VISNGRKQSQLLGRGLVGVRASDGKLLWNNNRVANHVANISTPIVKDDYVLASTGYQTGSVLLQLTKAGDGVAAREVYFLEPTTLQNHHGGLVLVGDHVYAGHGHNKGFPICVDLKSGKVVWAATSGMRERARRRWPRRRQPVFRYQNGTVLPIEATPAGYKEKGSFAIPGVKDPGWSHPVVLDGILYLREQDTLYAYDVKRH
jgi:hypothetical protein